MIYVNIIGGLGNQMFQYACGRALSLRKQESLCLVVDEFEHYGLHNGYELKKVFGIDAPLAHDSELKSLLGFKSHLFLRKLLSKPIMSRFGGDGLLTEPHFKYWSGINDFNPPFYIQGYWQSEKYFEDYSDVIREDFSFVNPLSNDDLSLIDKMKRHQCVAIHVRRGDYLSRKNRGVYSTCSMGYYDNAIRYLTSCVGDLNLFFFSDDPDWVQENFGRRHENVTVVRNNFGKNSSNDMRLMAMANHNIISNSSFSWWGAWLNKTSDKIVVAPQKWFKYKTHDFDLIPQCWIRI